MMLHRLQRCTRCTNTGRFRRSFSAASSSNDPNDSDVLIVGGGAVGCTMAKLLNERLPSLRVSLLEARDAPSKPVSTTTPSSTTTIPHPRSYALSPKSLELLGPKVLSQLSLGKYHGMQVWEACNPATLYFTTDDLPETQDEESLLGAVVEDGPLVAALWQELENHSSTTLYTNTTVQDVQLPSNQNNNGPVTVQTTTSNAPLTTRLLVAADGGNSALRKMLGLSQVGWDYGRLALTFTVELEHDVQRKIAYQRFVQGGPLALLPTHSDRHAIVVWSTTPETVQHWKNQHKENPESLIHHLNDLLQQGPQRLPPLVEQTNSNNNSLLSNVLYGVERVLDTVQDAGAMMAATTQNRPWMAPPLITNISTDQLLSFPLACRHVQHYTVGNRVALIGDAAHTVHPMAGQGLNLGLADGQVLANVLVQAHEVGMEPNLAHYHDQRHRAVSAALVGMHSLHELYANASTPAMHAKSLGMNVVQNVGPLRRQIVQAATQGLLV